MTDLSWLTAPPVAHRGFHDGEQDALGKQASAFTTAAERGYAIECNIHLSSDGIPVTIRDGDLQRDIR